MPRKRRFYHHDRQICLYHGDSLEILRELQTGSVDCIVTSPPYYGLRDYGTEGQYGLEKSPAEYVETLRALFSELRRVLADDGTLWLNLGDSYASGDVGRNDAGRNFTGGGGNKLGTGNPGNRKYRALDTGLPAKNLLGIPWMVAFALQDDGWILRNDIIWHKPNSMPESVTDQLSGRYEHVFMLTKSRRYWFNLDAIREPAVTTSGRNPGDVWEIGTQPFSAAHFAVMPIELAQRAILAGCKPGGTVLDPFSGSGTTGRAALNTKRRFIGIDINAEYLKLSLTHPHRFGKGRDVQ